MKLYQAIILSLTSFIVGGITLGAVIAAPTLATRFAGRILLQVQSKGEAWYVDPVSSNRYYLGRAHDCFDIMRQKGLGITNANLAQIPVATDSKIPDMTQDWLVYNADFAEPNAGIRDLTFKYPPHLFPFSEGKIPDGCTNCTAKTRFEPGGPGFRIPTGLSVTQSQDYLSIDKDKLGFEYQLAKSTTDNSFVTIKVVEHDASKHVFQAVFRNPNSKVVGDIAYFKFEMGAIVYNDAELGKAKSVFQEILNSIRVKE